MGRSRRNRDRHPPHNTSVPDGLTTDDIDTFVASRHASIQQTLADLSDSDSGVASDEPELLETNVLDIEMSDSDSANGSSSELDGAVSGDERKEREERLGFGGKKRDWYGGDTHEYEIMSDEEREQALKDEEEEARRLQREALERMVPEDYMEVEEEEKLEELRGEKEGKRENAVEAKRTAVEVLETAAPELPLLVTELKVSAKEMEIWKGRLFWGEVARIMYHLHASLAVNISFYLSLRTDPEMEGIDPREHPVLERIVKIQEMMDIAKELRCREPANGDVKVKVDDGEAANGSGKVEVANGKGQGEIKEELHPVVTDIPTEKPVRNEIDTENHVGNEGDGKEANSEMNGVAGAAAKKEKRKKRKDRKQRRKERKNPENKGEHRVDHVKTDEDNVRSLLIGTSRRGEINEDQDQNRARKRKKLSKLVGEMERERKNADVRQRPSADAVAVREEPNENKPRKALLPENGNDEMHISKIEDDDDVMQKMLAKKAKKEARKAKAAESKPHVYTFKDNVDPESRRKASSQIVKNRGLTRYRPKDKKTPRARNRLAYSKAVVRRKGAVQEYDGKPGVSYSGEASGINMAARKGSRLSNV